MNIYGANDVTKITLVNPETITMLYVQRNFYIIIKYMITMYVCRFISVKKKCYVWVSELTLAYGLLLRSDQVNVR